MSCADQEAQVELRLIWRKPFRIKVGKRELQMVEARHQKELMQLKYLIS